MLEETTEQTIDPNLTASAADVFGDDLPPDETQETRETTETTPKEPKTPPTLTAEQIRDSVRDGVRSAQPQGQQPAKVYTQEELDTLFKVWKPSDELVTQILAGGGEALKALLAMRDGMSQQFATLLEYQLEIAKQELTAKFEPALTYTQQRAVERDQEKFFAENEDLVDHRALVETVFNALRAEGFVAKDVPEAYRVLADRTRKLLPTNGANGSGARQSTGARQQTTTQSRRPASLSSGSQAGGGSGSSAPAAPYPGGEVFL